MTIHLFKKILIKIFAIAYISITVFCVFVFPLPWLIGIPFHNFNLYVLERRFDTIDHPSKSHLIERAREVGLFGNSNHCDYAIGEFRESSLLKEDVENFYKDKSVESLAQGPISLKIYFMDNINSEYFMNGPFLNKLKFLATTTKSIYSNNYLVLFIDPMNPPTGDYRCH